MVQVLGAARPIRFRLTRSQFTNIIPGRPRGRLNVISRTRLKEFVTDGHADAAVPLFAWYTAAKKASWRTFAELKQTFGSADLVGDCVVFDIGGNNYRLIARLRYPLGRVYVLRVMTHAVYDGENWAKSCGCFEPPPAPPRPKPAVPRTRKPAPKRKPR